MFDFWFSEGADFTAFEQNKNQIKVAKSFGNTFQVNKESTISMSLK